MTRKESINLFDTNIMKDHMLCVIKILSKKCGKDLILLALFTGLFLHGMELFDFSENNPPLPHLSNIQNV